MAIENDPKVVGSLAAWQNILNGNGYQPPLSITGELDDATKETTRKFQKNLDLPVTGSVDAATWVAGLNHAKLPNWSPETPPIRAKAPVSSAKIENDPKVVGSLAAWQNILNGNGYQPPLRITGELDDPTKETTRKFQNDVKLPVTGSVDIVTWAAGLKHPKLPKWSPETPPIRAKELVTKAEAEHIFEKPISDALFGDLNNCLEKFAINTSPRIRHFMAQISHESGGLQWLKELGGQAYFTEMYEDYLGLGNTEPGDGARFAGAGAIQLTGRYNYQAFADYIGDPEVMDGQEYVASKYPFTSAGFWWWKNRMNTLVDSGASVDEVGARVNGKFLPNGYEDRRYYYYRASEVI
jgi:putative chitinase